MSGGEDHAGYLRRTGSLDAFVRCEVDDCGWHVLIGSRRCSAHGGPTGPEYRTDSDGGRIAVRHMDRRFDPDFDPAA